MYIYIHTYVYIYIYMCAAVVCTNARGLDRFDLDMAQYLSKCQDINVRVLR